MFQGKTQSGPHGDFIFELDWIVGELLDTLVRLHVADNTLVIFSSDNGPEVLTVYHMRRDHGHDGAHPWRGMKRDTWEGGHRVPFLVRWPGKVPAGSTSQETICLTDVMATVAAVLGVTLPPDAAEDSVNILPALRGERLDPPRDILLHQGFGGIRTLAIRSGPWKYLHHRGSGGNNYATHPMLKEYQLTERSPQAPGQLYHLLQDPGERTNLYEQHPEVVNELVDKLQRSVSGEHHHAAGRQSPGG
jgi:arylsulfatase A-like enzyme